MKSNLLLGFGTLAFFFWLSSRDNADTKMTLESLLNAVFDIDSRFPDADADIKMNAVRLAEVIQRHSEEIAENMKTVSDVPWLLNHMSQSGTNFLKRAQALHSLELKTVQAGFHHEGDDDIILATQKLVDFVFAQMKTLVDRYASYVGGEEAQISILKGIFSDYEHFQNNWKQQF